MSDDFKYVPPSHEIADSLVEMSQQIELGNADEFSMPACLLLREAADRVSRQALEIDRLWAALLEVAKWADYHDATGCRQVVDEALTNGDRK